MVELSGGGVLSASCVIVASGVSYRQLDTPGFPELTGAGVYYGAAMTEARACSQQHVVVIGAANSAGQAAVYFGGYASKVTMLVRGSSLEKSMSHYLIEQVAARGNIEVRTSTSAVAAEGEGGRLRRLHIQGPDGEEEMLEADACFVFIGASPRTDWLEGVVARDERGFILAGRDAQADGWPLQREPYVLESSVPGVFVAGDVRARSIPAGRQRSWRGLDGRLADPRVSGRSVSDAPITLEELRTVDLFDELTDEELAQWVAVARPSHVAPGEIIAEQGEEPLGLQLLLEGDAQALILADGRSEPVGRHRAPTWMGAISVLTGHSLGVRMLAETACRLAIVAPEDFRRLAFAQPAVNQRVMQQVAPVTSRVTAIEQNRERLASLGTMAAGLAHELNNPAAAARRAAEQMTEALDAIGSALASFVEAGVERDEAEQLLLLQQQAVAHATAATALDTLDASDAEEELLGRLEALDIAEPWQLAEPLAVAGVDQQWLDRVAALAGPATGAALRWVAATLTAGRLAAELQESTERMSALVGAVKS